MFMRNLEHLESRHRKVNQMARMVGTTHTVLVITENININIITMKSLAAREPMFCILYILRQL